MPWGSSKFASEILTWENFSDPSGVFMSVCLQQFYQQLSTYSESICAPLSHDEIEYLLNKLVIVTTTQCLPRRCRRFLLIALGNCEFVFSMWRAYGDRVKIHVLEVILAYLRYFRYPNGHISFNMYASHQAAIVFVTSILKC